MQRQRLPRRPLGLMAGLAMIVAGCAGAERVSFSRDVQPILSAKCAACHPVSYPHLDLRPGRAYDQLVRVPAATNLAFHRVLPGRPELSYVLTHPPDPILRGLLGPEERETIRRWIAEGAADN